MTPDQPLSIVIDGVETPLGMGQLDPLPRAVIISLFTWRRALPDDPVDGVRMGWWADGLDGVVNDRIGSRLWLLSREKLTLSTINRAREYARESLQWLLDDGVATGVAVTAERYGMDQLRLQCVISRAQGAPVTLRFDNAWRSFDV